MNASWARGWHALTFVVVLGALLLQLVLVIDGASVLDETATPPLGTRLLRLVSYFTIQANVLVAVGAAGLIRDPHRDGAVWRVVRLDAVVGIAVTGVVHWFLLRPLLDLSGANALADRMLHLVVPFLAVVGWLLFGPRPRIERGTVLRALIWPVAWLVYILGLGAVTGWYPYPFLDVGELGGYAPVLLAAGGVTVLFLACFVLAAGVDRRLPPAPGEARGSTR